jgi:hypothetical protein
MRKIIPFAALFYTLFSFSGASAQTEISHLFVKGYYPVSTGAFLDIGIRTTRSNMLMIEPSLEYFVHGSSQYAFVFPTLAGIRHMFNGTGHGFYIEPLAGYMFGSTTIPKTNAAGRPLTDANGDTIDQKGNGVMAGIGLGYIIPHSNAFTIELRYEHTFIDGHPQLDILGLRFTYTLIFRRNCYQ